AETASCSVLKLNSTLARATHEVEAFTRQFEEVFKATEAKLLELSKKLPGQLTQQAAEAAAQLRQRGVLAFGLGKVELNALKTLKVMRMLVLAWSKKQGQQPPVQDVVHKVLQALQRLQRMVKGPALPHLVLRLSPEAFAFCHLGGVDEGSQTWSHFQVARLFQEYRIESKRSNHIDLEVQIPNLLHVFGSCASSDYTSLRLANGQVGCEGSEGL
ncbi:Checkpoint protein hus1, partial [Durusdinium trenchii]